MGATYREWEGDQLDDRLATLLPYLPFPHCLIITNLTVLRRQFPLNETGSSSERTEVLYGVKKTKKLGSKPRYGLLAKIIFEYSL